MSWQVGTAAIHIVMKKKIVREKKAAQLEPPLGGCDQKVNRIPN
jgi:hypothetical protein